MNKAKVDQTVKDITTQVKVRPVQPHTYAAHLSSPLLQPCMQDMLRGLLTHVMCVCMCVYVPCTQTQFMKLDPYARAALIVVPIFVAGYVLSWVDLAVALFIVVLYAFSFMLKPSQVGDMLPGGSHDLRRQSQLDMNEPSCALRTPFSLLLLLLCVCVYVCVYVCVQVERVNKMVASPIANGLTTVRVHS